VEPGGAKSGALIDDFARWVRRLAIVYLPFLGIVAFVGRHIVSERWAFLIDLAPPLLIATTIAAQVAWLERLFEYQRRFKAGFWTEVLIMLTTLTLYAAVLPMTGSKLAGAWVFGAVYASAMLARAHASMNPGVSRVTSRVLLVTVTTASSMAGLIAWFVQVP
jgi:hypothetical protein